MGNNQVVMVSVFLPLRYPAPITYGDGAICHLLVEERSQDHKYTAAALEHWCSDVKKIALIRQKEMRESIRTLIFAGLLAGTLFG